MADRDTKLLTSAFCAGLLERHLEEDVNIINAEMLLRERGIELKESRSHEMGAFSSTISVTVSGGGQTVTAAGTVFGRTMPRLVMLNEYRLEAYMDGKLLIFTHKDVPGIIGRVGTAFGKHQVNIGQMSVGRSGDTPGGSAIGVLNLDGQPTQAALDDMLSIDAVDRVQVIDLPPAGELPVWLR